MRYIKLDKERPYEINMNVLEAFEDTFKKPFSDITLGSMKEMKMLIILALREADSKIELTDTEIGKHIKLSSLKGFSESLSYFLRGEEDEEKGE